MFLELVLRESGKKERIVDAKAPILSMIKKSMTS